MDKNTNNRLLKVIGGYPLRGSLELNSSPNITKFMLSLCYILGGKYELKGTFQNSSIKDYCAHLEEANYAIKYSSNSIYIDSAQGGSDFSLLKYDTIEDNFLVALSLEKKGYVEITKNQELVDFLSYLGFLVKKKSNEKYAVYNKVQNPRPNLVFQELNYKYLLLGILFQLLNLEQFSITFPNDSLEIGIILELLSEIGVLKEVDHSKNVQLTFEKTKSISSSFSQIVIPGDPLEFAFFTTLSLFTEGEIQINGLKPSFLTTLLRVYSSIGGGYTASDPDILRTWFSGSDEVNYDLSEILEDNDQEYLSLLLPGLGKSYSSNFILPPTKSVTKNLIQDLNRLGGNISMTDEGIDIESGRKYKPGFLSLEGDIFPDFSRLVLSLISDGEFGIYNIEVLEDYNFRLLEKLKKLGARIQE